MSGITSITNENIAAKRKRKYHVIVPRFTLKSRPMPIANAKL